MVQERKWAALRVSTLSGIPTIMIPLFLHCPVSAPGLFLGAHSRRPRQNASGARGHSPYHEFNTSGWPDVIPNFDL